MDYTIGFLTKLLMSDAIGFLAKLLMLCIFVSTLVFTVAVFCMSVYDYVAHRRQGPIPFPGRSPIPPPGFPPQPDLKNLKPPAVGGTDVKITRGKKKGRHV